MNKWLKILAAAITVAPELLAVGTAAVAAVKGAGKSTIPTPNQPAQPFVG